MANLGKLGEGEIGRLWGTEEGTQPSTIGTTLLGGQGKIKISLYFLGFLELKNAKKQTAVTNII